MQIPQKPVLEDARLALLKDLDLLNSDHIQALDKLVELAAQICQTPMSAVSLVYEDKQFFKASVGLATRETGRDESFCGHAILADQLFVVEDAKLDSRFEGNPLVDGPPFIRFYAGMPLVSRDSLSLGTLCVLDSQSRQLSPQQREALFTLGRQASYYLELRLLNKRLQQTMGTLLEENTQRMVLSQKMAAMSSIVHDLHHELRNYQLSTQPQVEMEKKKFAVLFATHDLVEVWESIEPELFKVKADSHKGVEEANNVIARKDLNAQQKKFMLSMLGSGLSFEKAQALLTTVLQLDPGYQASIQALFGVLDSFLHMTDGARRLNGMTASLLDQLASESSGDVFEINPAVAGTLSLFSKRSRSSGISLSLRSDASLHVKGNRSDFQHVLLNLLSIAFEQLHAAEFVDKKKQISLEAQVREGRVCFELICAGLTAREAELRKQLFQDPKQLEPSQVELGWSVAQHLAQENHWQLELLTRGEDVVFLCCMGQN